MVKLPEIQPRGSVTRAPQSSLSPAEIANPFQQIANALESWGDTFQKKEIADAATAGENAVYRDQQGNLKVDLQSNLSARGRAYNAAAAQGYSARVAGEIRAAGVRLSNEAKGNVDAFSESWRGFRDQMLANTPADYRGAVTTMLDTEGPRLQLGVSEQKRTSDLKEFEGNIKSEIQFLDDEAATLARSGGTNTPAYMEKTQQIRTLYQQLADNPDFVVGQGEADIALKRMEGRHMSEAMLGQVDKALSSPNGVAEARKLTDAILTDSNIPLSPSERRQYAGLANERINGFVAQAKANLKPVQDRSTAIQKRLKEGVGLDADDVDQTAMELARGGDLAGATELISSRALARTLQVFRGSDNPQQVAMAENAMGNINRPAPGHSRPVNFNPDATGRMQEAMGHFKARGLDPIRSAAIIGHLMQESGINPKARNKGDGTDGSDSIGIAQWNGARAQALKDFAAQRGVSPDDLGTQLDFVLEELKTTENASYQRLMAATTVEEATAAMMGYERPQGWTVENPRGGHGWNNRLAAASKAAELAGVDPKLIAATEQAFIDPELVKEYRTEVTSDAKALFADIKAGNDRGLTPAVSNIDLLSRQLAMVDDQDFRKEVADYFTAQAATAGAAGLAPAQLESLIAGLRSDNADGFTVAQAQIVQGLEDTAKAQQDALKNDPLGYGLNRRLIQQVPGLDLQQPESWAQTFQGLQNGVDVMRARGLTGNIPALRPGMQQQIQQFLTTATPGDAVQFLGTMQASLSPDTYQATMSAISGKGNGTAFAAAGALVGENPAAAEGILRGQALLKENPLLAPKKTDENKAATDELLNPEAFAPFIEGSRQQLIDAATARYADLSNQTGDTSGEFNETRMQQAIAEVTGGMLELNGASVIAPRYGMPQADFDKLIYGLKNTDLEGAMTISGNPVKAEDLQSQGRLRAIADGMYMLEFGPPDAPTYALQRPSPGGYGRPSAYILDLRGK